MGNYYLKEEGKGQEPKVSPNQLSQIQFNDSVRSVRSKLEQMARKQAEKIMEGRYDFVELHCLSFVESERAKQIKREKEEEYCKAYRSLVAQYFDPASCGVPSSF